MNWDAVGAIGQIIGSGGVLISIAYLAIQVGHARDAVTRSARQARSDANVRIMLARATDESSRRAAKMSSKVGYQQVFVAALMEQTGVTAEEAYGEFFEQFAGWYLREYSLSNVDQLRPGDRAAIERGTRFVYGTHPISRLWYEKMRATNTLNPDIVRYIDNLLAQPG